MKRRPLIEQYRRPWGYVATVIALEKQLAELQRAGGN